MKSGLRAHVKVPLLTILHSRVMPGKFKRNRIDRYKKVRCRLSYRVFVPIDVGTFGEAFPRESYIAAAGCVK